MRDNKSFDFEYWSKLAKDNPEKFELKRAEMVGNLIDTAPNHLQNQLQSLQWRVNVERDRSSTPLSACMKISRMMWEAVYSKKGGFMSLMESPPKECEKAKVIPFHIKDPLH